MFELFKKEKKDVKELYAPVEGKMLSLEEVPDKVFSSKLMGDGVAFNFDKPFIFAPCDCEVIMIASTKHAIGLKTINGIEIMIHVGLNTVELKGEGFKHFKCVGDMVKKGEKLIEIDANFMKEKNINLITPMIITSKQNIEIEDVKDVDNKTIVIRAK